jgi:hypothetical protein
MKRAITFQEKRYDCFFYLVMLAALDVARPCVLLGESGKKMKKDPSGSPASAHNPAPTSLEHVSGSTIKTCTVTP